MLQEEAMFIKERPNNRDFEHFSASNGWLKNRNFHMDYVKLALPEKLMTYFSCIHSWIERLPDLTDGHDIQDQWNMYERGLFFKALPDRLQLVQWPSIHQLRQKKSCCQTLFWFLTPVLFFVFSTRPLARARGSKIKTTFDSSFFFRSWWMEGHWTNCNLEE